MVDQLLFFPAKYPSGEWAPTQLRYEDVYFSSADNTRLHGWYCPCDQPRATILIAHGNAGHVASRVDWLRYLQSTAKVSVFMFDYRGYGRSEGRPTVRGVLEDASAARAKLKELTGLADSEMLLMGESIGGAVVVQLAAQSPPRGLILQSTFPSLRDVAAVHFPGLSWLVPKSTLDSASAIAGNRAPLLQSHGDRDRTIPFAAGEKLFRAANEPKFWFPIKGADHNNWLQDEYLKRLDQFISDTAGVGAAAGDVPSNEQAKSAGSTELGTFELRSPQPYEVSQRASNGRGQIKIEGKLLQQASGPDKSLSTPELEARWTAYELKDSAPTNEPGAWQKLKVSLHEHQFESSLEVPAGGWYRLEVRLLQSDRVAAYVDVAPVGVGEVFIVAGQSNSANYGEERQKTSTSKVASFDGERWQLANDPQAGADGTGGSFMPPLGDELVKRLGVPVGFVPCGIGATSVREWLPRGIPFPDPPTLIQRVQSEPDGMWSSRGDAFDNLVARMTALGPHGFRAVLWHQGESDANQSDPKRTLPGTLYRQFLTTIIQQSKTKSGSSEAPWLVAQASYHTPEDVGSDDIRTAQASLWRDAIALPGPDSDQLQGTLRSENGAGVHFSGPGLRKLAALWVDKILPVIEGR